MPWRNVPARSEYALSWEQTLKSVQTGDVAGLETDNGRHCCWLDRVDYTDAFDRRTALRCHCDGSVDVRPGDRRPYSRCVARVLDPRAPRHEGRSDHRIAVPVTTPLPILAAINTGARNRVQT